MGDVLAVLKIPSPKNLYMDISFDTALKCIPQNIDHDKLLPDIMLTQFYVNRWRNKATMSLYVPAIKPD